MQSVIRKCRRALMVVVLVGAFLSPTPSHAQSTYGSLTGQVTDPTGAAIAGASATLNNVDTNYSQTTNTDSTGVYLFKLVSPGDYSLTISARGFAEYVQKGIVINANLYATQNVGMRVATAQGEVGNVTADTELINTTTAEMAMTVNSQSVADLPLNGRAPSTLALLAPGMVDAGKAGVVWTQPGFSFGGESAASANGGRIGSTFYMLDGVSNMEI